MQCNSVELAYFSPSGGTRRIVERIGRELDGEPAAVHDLLRQPPEADIPLPSGSLLVVGMPVYGGRIPQPCLPLLRRLKGRNNPALAVVVYGNRDYEDALLELKNTLGGSGFIVTGAAAFIARHSIFPMVAADRPDADDERLAAEFARRCAARLADMEALTRASAVEVKGKAPYREPMAGGPRPGLAAELCTRCGACVEICPTRALSLPEEGAPARDEERCIGCAACVAVCPTHAQAWRGPQYEAMSRVFAEKCAARREPELFV